MKSLHNSKALIWPLLLAFTLAWLYVLGIRTLVPPDEGRYAEMAREMLVSGDWITTRLNGIKYFEKPPLQTWMNALSFAAFGLGEWQARLWTGVCGWLGVMLTAYAGYKIVNQRVGFYAGLVLASSFFWVASSQIDSLDMSLSCMMTISLCSLLMAQRDGVSVSGRRNWMLLCWVGMALAVLAKGLIGVVLPGAVLVLYMFAARDWTIWARLHLLKGLLLFFAIATPWFVLVALKNPEQPHFFFIHEHFERFFLKTHHREGAWYYFFAMLIPGIVPWLGLLPQSLLGAFKPVAKPVAKAAVQAADEISQSVTTSTAFKPALLCLIWAVFIFFFFSYSSSKLPGYILPIFPALALLLAMTLEHAGRRSAMLTAALVALMGLIGIALVPQMPKAAHQAAEVGLMLAYQPWALAAGVVAVIGAALALKFTLAFDKTLQKYDARDCYVLCLAITGFVSTELLLTGFEPYGKLRAGLALVPAIKAELLPDTKIYSVGIFEQSLPFYLRRKMILVDYVDEFGFGLEQQPELALASVDAFVAQWTQDAGTGVRDLAITGLDTYQDLLKRQVPMRIVAQDSRRIVLSNLVTNSLQKTTP